MVKGMEKKEYSVVEFIQHLKDKLYIKLNKAARLNELKIRGGMWVLWRGVY
jgi:hypothetical protein